MRQLQLLTVNRVTRGRLTSINNDGGAQLAYWSPVEDAPRVGTVLRVTLEDEDG